MTIRWYRCMLIRDHIYYVRSSRKRTAVGCFNRHLYERHGVNVSAKDVFRSYVYKDMGRDPQESAAVFDDDGHLIAAVEVLYDCLQLDLFGN